MIWLVKMVVCFMFFIFLRCFLSCKLKVLICFRLLFCIFMFMGVCMLVCSMISCVLMGCNLGVEVMFGSLVIFMILF